MDVNLEGYQFEEYLTLHEATCLILGANPDEISIFDFEAVKEQPKYSLVFDQLLSDLDTLIYQKHIPAIPRFRDLEKKQIIDMPDFLKKLEIIFVGNTVPEIIKRDYPEINLKDDFKYDQPKKGQVRSCAPEELAGNHPIAVLFQNHENFSSRSYQIKQSAIKQWLNLKGVQSKYFDTFVGLDNKETAVKKGFNIANPDKTIPALHKVLIDNDLIDDIKLDDFEDAFLNGNGLIQWRSKGTHGVGASNLGYFLKKMSSEKIIKSTHKIEVLRIAENIFKFKGGSTPIAQSLNNSAIPNDYKLFDNVVKDLKNI